jgi:hypothetical protein
MDIKKTTASNLHTRFVHLINVTQTCHAEAQKGEAADARISRHGQCFLG